MNEQYNNKTNVNWSVPSRGYDPGIGRFTGVDPKAEKYTPISPYAYVANNPIIFIDKNGESINFNTLLNVDKILGTNITGMIVNDLEKITGFGLSVDSDGDLNYDIDESGNAIVGRNQEGEKVGSSEARKLLKSAIDNPKTANVGPSPSGGSKSGGLAILISDDEISGFIDGTSNDLNDNTLGYGMTFLHELDHTDLGSGGKDPKEEFGPTGPIVDRMNKIRSELGNSYGQRSSYKARKVGRSNYIPFSENSEDKLINGEIPSESVIEY